MGSSSKRGVSPTVAMLETGRQQHKRTVGAFSTYSGRSYFHDEYFSGTRETTPFDLNPHQTVDTQDNGSTVLGKKYSYKI
jgi:hypothetical protein